jgi:hypothetical protein
MKKINNKTKKLIVPKIKSQDNGLHLPLKLNAFTIISIIVVVVFILVIVGGLLRFYYVEPTLPNPTDVQLITVKSIIASDLQSKGDSIDNYQFVISKKIRHLDQNKGTPGTLQVCLYNNLTRHLFLVDINNSEILMHSETEFYNSTNGTSQYAHYYQDFDLCHSR